MTTLQSLLLLWLVLTSPLAAIESHEWIGLAAVAIAVLLAVCGCWARMEVRLARIEAQQEYVKQQGFEIDQIWSRVNDQSATLSRIETRLTVIEMQVRKESSGNA